MRMKTLAVQLLRWVLASASVVAGLYSLNLAFFHGWASGFRDSHADWHARWSNIFLASSVFLFLAAGFIVWYFRRSRAPTDEKKG